MIIRDGDSVASVSDEQIAAAIVAYFDGSSWSRVDGPAPAAAAAALLLLFLPDDAEENRRWR